MTAFTSALEARSRSVMPAIILLMLWAAPSSAATLYHVTGRIGAPIASDLGLIPAYGDFAFYFSMGGDIPGYTSPGSYLGGPDFSTPAVVLLAGSNVFESELFNPGYWPGLPTFSETLTTRKVTWDPAGSLGSITNGRLTLDLEVANSFNVWYGTLELYFPADFNGAGSIDPLFLDHEFKVTASDQLQTRWRVDSATVSPVVDPVPVPEPATALLISGGLLVLARRMRRAARDHSS